MWSYLLLSAALAFGRQETADTDQPALERPTAAAAPTPETNKASANPAIPPLPDRWLLMKELQGTWVGDVLDGNRLSVSGWTDLGYTASTAGHNNLPLGFNYIANELVLQQNWLRIERRVVTEGTSEPTFGFRSDWILPGTDYRFTVARGLFSSQLTADNGQPDEYGIDPIQFYAEAYFPTIFRGLDVKVGRFYGQYGVESNEAPGNALFSHTYSFIDNPFTQSGILGTAKLDDAWTVQMGLVNGQDVWADPGELPQFIGTAKWTSSDQRDTATLSTIVASGRFNQARRLNNADLLDLVYTHKVNARLNYTWEGLVGYETHITDVGTAYWGGIVNYLTYDFTPRLSGTARVEFFDDPQGVRTGSPGLYSAFTAGLSFKPRKSILIRPELRYDYNNESPAFEGQHGLFTAATDLILRW